MKIQVGDLFLSNAYYIDAYETMDTDSIIKDLSVLQYATYYEVVKIDTIKGKLKLIEHYIHSGDTTVYNGVYISIMKSLAYIGRKKNFKTVSIYDEVRLWEQK